MPRNAHNWIGSRGEAIFKARMLKPVHGEALFRLSFLGEQWEAVDYLCELVGAWKGERPFFFVQVKTTRKGYTKDRRLKVRIDRGDAGALSAYKAPVYLAGIDETDERVFIVAAEGRRVGALTSLHTGAEMHNTGAGLRALWDDVRRYWANVPRQRRWSMLHEPRWR